MDSVPGQISVFIIYAREDREIKDKLLRHLNPLKDPYNLNIWHDDYIEPGQEWKPRIESRLAQTDLFLLLISADFMNSEFIHQVEFKFAIDRHKQNKSIVIPVIINYCLWDIDIKYKDYTFNLAELQLLPSEGKPIDDWKTPEQAYSNIAGGIRKVLSAIMDNREQRTNEEKVKQAKITEEETAKRKKEAFKRERDDMLQKQLLAQKEKEDNNNITVVTEQDGLPNSGATKKIIYSLLILFAVSVIFYFIFRDREKITPGNSTRSATTESQLVDTTTPVNPGSGITSSNEDKAEYESSASMAYEKYTWNNDKGEINLSVRKYSDNFVEIDVYHRN